MNLWPQTLHILYHGILPLPRPMTPFLCVVFVWVNSSGCGWCKHQFIAYHAYIVCLITFIVIVFVILDKNRRTSLSEADRKRRRREREIEREERIGETINTNKYHFFQLKLCKHVNNWIYETCNRVDGFGWCCSHNNTTVSEVTHIVLGTIKRIPAFESTNSKSDTIYS